jgi:NADH-quinone oxidoreductase subunit J
MELTFYIAAAVAVLSTLMVITRYNIIHALLYLIVSFLAISIVFYVLGAPFMAALEIIIYAGAIVVLIIFVIMMLNLKEEATRQEKAWLKPAVWIGPCVLSAILLAELVYILATSGLPATSYRVVDAKGRGHDAFRAVRTGRGAERHAADGRHRGGVSPGTPEEKSGAPLPGAGSIRTGKGAAGRRKNTRTRNDFRMNTIPMETGLLLAGILFMLGLIGIPDPAQHYFMLISAEIMLNAAGLAFIVAGSRWAQPDGQVMFILSSPWPRRKCRWGWRSFSSFTTSSKPSTAMRPAR